MMMAMLPTEEYSGPLKKDRYSTLQVSTPPQTTRLVFGRVTFPNGPSAVSTTLWTLAILALLSVAALALTLWRRRRARQALASLASPPGSSRRNAVEAQLEFMAQARVVDERAPLKSGSTRLTSSRQLGQ